MLVVVTASAVVFGASCYGSDDSVVLDQFGDAKLENCCVSTTMFVLRWFNAGFQNTPLQNALGVGPHWADPTSIGQVKKTLESHGLNVEAYKDARIEEVVPHLRLNELCLLHTQQGNPPVGHFFVLVAGMRSKVLLVDAGKRHDWITIEQLKNQFQESFSGYCLFVSRDPSRLKLEHRLDESAIEVDMGTITNTPGNLDVEIPVLNTNAFPMTIEKAQGSCGCFRGASFRSGHPTQLGPGERQSLRLQFDRAAFGIGDVQRFVTLRIKGAESREVLIKVSAHVVQQPLEQRVMWFPKRIDYGLVKDRRVLEKAQDLVFWLPPGVMLGDVIPSSSNIVVTHFDAHESISDGGQDSRTAYHVNISLHTAQLGPFSEKISVTTSDTNYPLIEISLVGEIVEQ